MFNTTHTESLEFHFSDISRAGQNSAGGDTSSWEQDLHEVVQLLGPAHTAWGYTFHRAGTGKYEVRQYYKNFLDLVFFAKLSLNFNFNFGWG